MPLTKVHITTSIGQTKKLETVVGVAMAGNVVKGNAKKSSVVLGAAKKSFAGMIKQKQIISLALQKGESVDQIKGVRFVKPF